jgi:hypothetical protein
VEQLYPYSRKRKWLSTLLSVFVPGTGHFYLGLMQRGIFIMLLIAANIVAIVYSATELGEESTTFITLCGLLLTCIYFYSMFDAMQSTDLVNYRNAYEPTIPEDPLRKLLQPNTLGLLLITAGIFLFLFSSKPAWLTAIIHLMGTSVGSILLIVAGILLLYLNMKDSNKGDSSR